MNLQDMVLAHLPGWQIASAVLAREGTDTLAVINHATAEVVLLDLEDGGAPTYDLWPAGDGGVFDTLLVSGDLNGDGLDDLLVEAVTPGPNLLGALRLQPDGGAELGLYDAGSAGPSGFTGLAVVVGAGDAGAMIAATEYSNPKVDLFGPDWQWRGQAPSLPAGVSNTYQVAALPQFPGRLVVVAEHDFSDGGFDALWLLPYVASRAGLASSGPPLALPLQPFNRQDIALADFDGDGIQDLAIASESLPGVAVVPVRADGGFGSAGLQPTPAVNGLGAVDLNGDGYADLLVTSGNRLLIYLGAGAFQFNTPDLANGTCDVVPFTNSAFDVATVSLPDGGAAALVLEEDQDTWVHAIAKP